jgi:uncharacterized protein (TIGR02452 family)
MCTFEARIAEWRDTVDISNDFEDPPASIKVHLQVHGLYLFYGFQSMYRRFARTTITVEDIDALDCGLREGGVVLNLADDTFPGGCVAQGSGAQEESLFRRSNYHRTLTVDMYPLLCQEVILSKGVTIFKRSESDGWKRYEAPLTMDFIACPGIRNPALRDGRYTASDEERMKAKVEVILQAAATAGHGRVVLGALGCGAWKCPARHTAQIFADALRRWDGVFERVTFAVKKMPRDTYIVRPEIREVDNHDVFASVFASVFAPS